MDREGRRDMSDALHMAQAIEAVAAVDENGLVTLGSLDTYAHAIGVSCEDASSLMAEAWGILESEGVVETRRGSHYMVKREGARWEGR